MVDVATEEFGRRWWFAEVGRPPRVPGLGFARTCGYTRRLTRLMLLRSYRPLASGRRRDSSVWSWHNRARGCSRSLKTAGRKIAPLGPVHRAAARCSRSGPAPRTARRTFFSTFVAHALALSAWRRPCLLAHQHGLIPPAAPPCLPWSSLMVDLEARRWREGRPWSGRPPSPASTASIGLVKRHLRPPPLHGLASRSSQRRARTASCLLPHSPAAPGTEGVR